MTLISLNRRQKTALCATLACVGLIVLLGGGLRQAVGISLLGIAFSWTFGSNSRFIHWLFVAFGLLLLIPSAWDGLSWVHQKPEVIKGQMAVVQTDNELIKNQESLLAETPPGIERAKTQEELSKAMIELFHDNKELRHLQAESVLRHVIENDWQTVVGGLLLMCSGVGLLVLVKPNL
jgi:hypothetical protein